MAGATESHASGSAAAAAATNAAAPAAAPAAPALTLVEAGGDGHFNLTTGAGSTTLTLHLHYAGPPPAAGSAAQHAALVLSLASDTQGVPTPKVALRAAGAATAATGACGSAAAGACAELALGAEWLSAEVTLAELAANTSYTGVLRAFLPGATQEWPVNVHSVTRGAIEAVKLPVIQVRKRWCFPLCDTLTEVPFWLWDKSRNGPYTNVKAQMEIASGAIPEGAHELPAGALDFEPAAEPDKASSPLPRLPVTLPRSERVEIMARLGELPAGAYRGRVRFVSPDADSTQEASAVDVEVQVGHFWLAAVLVILLGSVVGWWLQVFVPARRARRDSLLRIEELRRRAYRLTGLPQVATRRLPTEGGSHALNYVQSQLSRAGDLCRSTSRFIVLRDYVEHSLDGAARRLRSLELYAGVRLSLQPEAEQSWASHWRLFGQLNQFLERIEAVYRSEANVDDAAAKQIDDELQALKAAWSDGEQRKKSYREALVARTRDYHELLLPGSFPETIEPTVAKLREELLKLPDIGPSAPEPSEADLALRDDRLERLRFAWRHKQRAWLDAVLPSIASESLEKLQDFANEQLWYDWDQLAQRQSASRGVRILGSSEDRKRVYEFGEFAAELEPDFDRLIARHPTAVVWRICLELEPGPPRRWPQRWQWLWPRARSWTVETDRARLVRFFPSRGEARLSAALRWNGREIPLGMAALRIQSSALFRGDVLAELAVIAFAAVVAGVIGLSERYNATFGSFSQYVAVFLWAAGISAGSNAAAIRQSVLRPASLPPEPAKPPEPATPGPQAPAQTGGAKASSSSH
jgi:hypothetical protein